MSLHVVTCVPCGVHRQPGLLMAQDRSSSSRALVLQCCQSISTCSLASNPGPHPWQAPCSTPSTCMMPQLLSSQHVDITHAAQVDKHVLVAFHYRIITWSPENYVQNRLIVLKFDRRFDSTAVETPVKFQSDTMILEVTISQLQGITIFWDRHLIRLYWNGLPFQTWRLDRWITCTFDFEYGVLGQYSIKRWILLTKLNLVAVGLLAM